MTTGTIAFPQEKLAHDITLAIVEEGSKPVMAARKIQEDMEEFLSNKLGIPIKTRIEPQLNAKQKNDKKKPYGSIIVHGQAWGYGASAQGVAGYYRDPQTGAIVWTDIPLEYKFQQRHDLSTQVWSAVKEQEQMILDVVRGGIAAGRDVKHIAGDLETFINYQNGGERVVGRWMGMFPNTEAGRREAWQREYLASHGNFQPGSDAARAVLRQDDARDWVSQKMAETTQHGTPRLPDAVRQCAARLGKAGLDYRCIRIARTETAAMLADEQAAIAKDSNICTGEMDWVLERGRDAWKCNCEMYAGMSPWKVDDPDRPEIPLHPNCMCEWVPRLKTDEEIYEQFQKDMKEELEAFEGSDDQRAMLDELHKWTCPKCGYVATIYENSKRKNAKECPVCGEGMNEDIVYGRQRDLRAEKIDDQVGDILNNENLSYEERSAGFKGVIDNNIPKEQIGGMGDRGDKIISSNKELEELAGRWYKGLTDEQRVVIEGYTNNDYWTINRYKRGLLSLEEAQEELPNILERIENLNAVLGSQHGNPPLLVRRTIAEELEEAIGKSPGEEIVIKAFTSTSIKTEMNFISGGPWDLHEIYIKVPENSRAGAFIGGRSYNIKEAEYLIRSDTRMRILHKTKNEIGNTIIVLEVVE